MRARWWPGLLVAFLVACPRPPPPPPPPPPARPDVPEGCMASLDGEWVHADDSSYRYLGSDDGGTLTLEVRHVVPVDAGFVPRHFGVTPPKPDAGTLRPTDAGLDAGQAAPVPDGGSGSGPSEAERPPPLPFPAPRIVLVRTTHGFVGETVAAVMHPAGRECPVTFKTEVVSCADAGLTLRSETAVAVGELCKAPAHPQPSPVLVHRLIRPSLDAGP